MANGGIIGPSNAPSAVRASGVWTITEALEAIAISKWPKPGAIEFLVLGGGGAGGNVGVGAGGGGGAGGLVFESTIATAGTYTIVIGAGSAGVNGGTSAAGTFSSAFGIVAAGGGPGVDTINDTIVYGASTGGGNGQAPNPGEPIFRQGSKGGTGLFSTQNHGGGGGGFSSAGVNAVFQKAGDGGSGYDLSLFVGGSSLGIAGGGGGSVDSLSASYVVGTGVDGGGTAGKGGTPGAAAAANRGGGGGASSNIGGTGQRAGGNGGSGRVVIRYPDGSITASGGTQTTATVGGVAYRFHTFTATGSFVVT